METVRVLEPVDGSPVAQVLQDLGVCRLCHLRVHGERNAEAYAAAAAAPAEPPSKRQKLDGAADGGPPPPCPLCCGLLQNPLESPCVVLSHEPAMTAAVLAGDGVSSPPVGPERSTACASLRDAVHAVTLEWEFSTFGLEISLPAALAVRAQALRWLLQERSGGAPLGHIVDLKEAFKLVFSHPLAQLSGAKVDQAAAMRVTLSCDVNDAMKEEVAWLAKPGHGLPGKKPRSWGRGPRQQQQEPVVAPLLASTSIVDRLAAMPREAFFRDCPPGAARLLPPPAIAKLALRAFRGPVYVGGRYRKLRRGVPQSPWIFDGQRREESSVTEEIARAVLPPLRADGYSFLSAGREDADVRMLGTGRPFALEIRNCRAAPPGGEACAAMAAAVAAAGGGIEVDKLQVVGAAQLAVLRGGDEEKRKSYAATVWLPRPVSDADLAALCALRELELLQRTPLRVAHRRANLERSRIVHEVRAERIEGRPEGYLRLYLTAQAGTYIKEFVHGDRGRCRPSVREILGAAAECVHLDVTGVEIDYL